MEQKKGIKQLWRIIFPGKDEIATKSSDSTHSKVENKGIWKRFFFMLKIAHIPYGLLIVYIIFNTIWSTIAVYIPQVNANFFTGDASVASVSLFLGVELFSTIFSQGQNYIGQRFRAKTNRNLRNALWSKILKLKPSYYDKVSANTLLSRITVDTESFNTFIMDIVLQIIFDIYLLVLTIKEMTGISIKASFYMLAFVPLSMIAAFIIGRLNLKFQNAVKFKMSDLTEYLSELMASLPVLKAFNRQQYESKRGNKVINDYYVANRNVVGLMIGRDFAGTVIGLIPEVVLIMIGIKMLQNSTLTPAGWYTLYVYSFSLLNFFNGICTYWENTKSVQGELNKVAGVLYEEEEILETYAKEIAESGDISFDNVSFSYGTTKALDNVFFTIPKNKTTAIVGYSGSGKSTILKLIERVYDPDEGRIMVAGKNLTKTDIKAWREKLAFVIQSSPMISGSIRDNITYGIKRDVTDDEIMQVANKVYVDGFINGCEGGLDYQVGQFGSKLSGGQRQKISIARALLSNPEYLILDEPTASLDIISAGEIARVIEELNGKITVIMIAHQPEIIKNVDHVIVMDKDHTAVEGNPGQLLHTNHFYATLTEGTKDGGKAV